MSLSYPTAMRRLINEFSKLPSIGEKSAARLAYYVVSRNRLVGHTLAEALVEACERTVLCETCFALSDHVCCSICADSSRNSSVVCVVEKPSDVIALERNGSYSGVYHVLHGLWSPLRGVLPEQLKIPQLVERITNASRSNGSGEGRIQEIILATGTTVEGDATALYIAKRLSEWPVRVTRIAQGLPKGGDLEFADDITLNHALEGRKAM